MSAGDETSLLAWLFSAAALLLSLACSVHALLFKREYRSTIGWVALLWLVPFLGVLLYLILGINRIERKAWRRVSPQRKVRGAGHAREPDTEHCIVPRAREDSSLRELMTLGDNINPQPLTRGNRVEMFTGAQETFDAMLSAIEAARESVAVCTYIFDYDRVGERFARSLSAARQRGVEVRVLADYVGCRDSDPPVLPELRRLGLRAEYFLPLRFPWSIAHFNLRNHRKLLIVDGRTGFTGGMNITADHLGSRQYPEGFRDVHFRIEGPVVRHLQEAFATDWYFASEEPLQGERWFPDLEPRGEVIARGIAHGPDEAFERLRLMLEGAVSVARESIRVLTPYFLPEPPLIHALNSAALRGVEVDILIPAQSDHPIADWAAQAGFWQLLERGVRIWRIVDEFDHGKLMVVDDEWLLLGSTNWDPRSLRLNFEFNVECYADELAQRVGRMLDEKRDAAVPVTLDEMDNRTLPERLRDSFARLFTPYL